MLYERGFQRFMVAEGKTLRAFGESKMNPGRGEYDGRSNVH